jgi:hypothetical protein
MTREENEEGSEGSRYLLRCDHLIRSVYLVYSLVVQKINSSREYLRIFGFQNPHAFSLYDIGLGSFSSALLSTSFASQIHHQHWVFIYKCPGMLSSL